MFVAGRNKIEELREPSKTDERSRNVFSREVRERFAHRAAQAILALVHPLLFVLYHIEVRIEGRAPGWRRSNGQCTHEI